MRRLKMKFYSCLLSCFTVLVLANSSALAEPLKLPEKSPNLKITKEPELGKLDSNIGLMPGAVVADFKVKDHLGKPLSFHNLLKQGTALVIFYRGGWCPYCNVQIRQLTEAWPEFQKRKITPILISVDKPDAAALAQKTYDIPFPVLSDSQLKAHEIFKVLLNVGTVTYNSLKLKGIDLEAWTDGKHHKIAVPSVFVVNSSAKVLWSHSSKNYSQRPSVKQLLAAIDGLKL